MCVLKNGYREYNARRMPISQSYLLQLSTGFNAAEVNERKFNPDYFAVTCKADHAGSSHRLRSQEFPPW